MRAASWVPVVGVVALALAWGRDLVPTVAVLVGLVLAGCVLAAVHHAEVVAARVGEPFGSLFLAVAVTVIEVALIVSLLLTDPAKNSAVARDTVFAAIMIAVNGIVGLCILLSALREHVTVFTSDGPVAALSAVAVLASLSLILPTCTTSTPGPTFSPAQLAFAGVASLAVYGTYVFVQTVRHRDYFLPVTVGPDGQETCPPDAHAETPNNRAAAVSLGLLLVSLVAVVGLAKAESPSIEDGIAALSAPKSFVGVVIAMLVLLPESIAAVRAARLRRVQTSLNLGLGSALASIGLTIPVVALASVWIDGQLTLGLGPTQIVLLALTVAIGAMTLVPGRATVLQGALHLSVFAAFLFVALVP